MILSVGTQFVTRVSVVPIGGGRPHPVGAVGVIVKAPTDATHAYSVRFLDATLAQLRREEFTPLKALQREQAGLALMSGDSLPVLAVDESDLRQHVIYRCIVGSRAYGLDSDTSDVDRRGVYLPPADRHWSLVGVPEQLEDDAAQECFWEVQKFLVLALKANPNVLECLYSPLVEHAAPLMQDLLAFREGFLSKLIYQTYNGYVLSQFRKLEGDLRQRGCVKWKHAMHLVRLLLSGIVALRERRVPLQVEEHRAELLAIKRGELPWPAIDRWRLALHAEFDAAYAATKLPERPDYAAANAWLIRARRSAASA